MRERLPSGCPLVHAHASAMHACPRQHGVPSCRGGCGDADGASAWGSRALAAARGDPRGEHPRLLPVHTPLAKPAGKACICIADAGVAGEVMAVLHIVGRIAQQKQSLKRTGRRMFSWVLHSSLQPRRASPAIRPPISARALNPFSRKKVFYSRSQWNHFDRVAGAGVPWNPRRRSVSHPVLSIATETRERKQ